MPLVPTDPYRGLDPSDERWLREQTGRIEAIFGRTVADMVDAGRIIAGVKERLGHGHFLTWVAAALPFSAATALRMVQVAEVFGDQIRHADEFDPTALYLLAQPGTPPEARELALRLAGEGRRITAAVARGVIREARPDAEPRPPRTVIAREQLRVLIPEGESEYHASFDLRLDPDGDLIVGIGGVTGRDLGAVLTQLAGQARPAPPASFVVPPDDHLDWCDGVAGGVARHHGFKREDPRWEDVRGAAHAALFERCRKYDPALRDPASTVTDHFRGWAHQYVRQAADREAKRQRNGGTYHTKRDGPEPVLVPLGEEYS